MEKYILYGGKIEGQYREVFIYPIVAEPDQFLVHWDGFEVGTISKMEGKWYTTSVDLINVTNELGKFIDENKDKFEGG